MRLSLHQPTEPFWLELPALGCRVQVAPLTMAVSAAIDAFVRRQVAAVAQEYLARQAENAPLDGLPDWTDADVREGHGRQMFAEALARFGIVAWEGVEDEHGNPHPVTATTKAAFARQAGDAFVSAYERGLSEVIAEGNASGAGRNGASAPNPTIAGAASQVH